MALSGEVKTKIDGYQPSDQAKQLVSQTPILLLAGPAGSGKSAVIKELLKNDSFTHIVSHTTRAPRGGEVDGQDYHFISESDLSQMLDEGKFIEVEAIYDEYASGTSVDEIQRIKDSGRTGMTAIEISGVKSYKELNPNTKTVFLLPPDYESWVERLSQRGEGQDAIRKMLTEAQGWIEEAIKSGYIKFIVNDDLTKAADEVTDYVLGKEGEDDDEAVEHAWSLLGELKRQLNS